MTGRREGQGGGCGLHCAHRTTVIHLIDPSNPFYRGGSASTETMPAVSSLPFQARLILPLGTTPVIGSTAAVERDYRCSLQARSLSLQGWGLIDLPLRASNEGLLRPRVARAQEIIRLHPVTFLLPAAANSVQRAGRSRSRRGDSGPCAGDWAWR